ncbi:MAG: GntR family transcriptional regulator [Firmicutes bacterium]|nr:GntR family transcriptional regulator [Bacillota bacterium]
MWPFKEGTPIYLQIIEEIKTRIVRGEYEAGSQVPPVRELAIEAGVNPNTVQRAFAQLESEGILKSDRTRGRFVTDEKSVLGELRKTMSSRFVTGMIKGMKELGMSDDEIIEAVSRQVKEESK